MLRDFDVTWFEEPLRADNVQGYVKLTENAPLPITSCEVLTRRQSFVPHGWNTAVGLAADLQLVAAVPTARWVEFITPSPYIDDLVEEPLGLDEEGMLSIPEAPGLGMRWSAAGVRRHSGTDLTTSDL